MTRYGEILTALAGLLTLPAQVAAQSLWLKVPPLPTACYTKGETFDADLEKLRVELDDALKRQEEVNNAISQKLAALDPMAQQSRMMAYMRKDPAGAQKYMESMANMAAQQQAGIRVVETRQALDEKLKTLQAQYVADAAPLTPLFTRFNDALMAGPSKPIFARAPEFAAAYDAAYDKFCPKWWGAASPFVDHLGERKQMLIEFAIPYGDEGAGAMKTKLDVMGIPTTGYKSTAEMEAVKEYLIAAQKIYKQRPGIPLKERQ